MKAKAKQGARGEATNEKWLVSTGVPAQDLCHVECRPTFSLQGSQGSSSEVTEGQSLLSCQACDISSADVVICSYRLLYSQIYLKRREARGRSRRADLRL